MSERLTTPLEYAFEGIDGGGKTTNIQKLERYYTEKGCNVVVLSGLSQTDFGRAIRRNIQKLNGMGIDGMKYFKEDIRRSYASMDGRSADILLWDRHIYSIFAANTAFPNLSVIRNAKPVIPEPPKVFLMNVPPNMAWMREQQAQKGDHPITPEWLVAKHAKYLELLKTEPERFVEIDTTESLDVVFGQLVKVIDDDLTKI